MFPLLLKTDDYDSASCKAAYLMFQYIQEIDYTMYAYETIIYVIRSHDTKGLKTPKR